MQIEIQARNFPVTPALRSHILRRLNFALSARYQQIHHVLVRLSDINGPRGGKDKCCLIQVTLPQLSDIVIEDIETDLYVAIDRAAARTSRTVTRKLGRKRDLSRVSKVPDAIRETSMETISLSTENIEAAVNADNRQKQA